MSRYLLSSLLLQRRLKLAVDKIKEREGSSPGDASHSQLATPHRDVSMTMSQKPLIIEVKVKPNARVSKLCQDELGQWLAQIKSLPVDGKANAKLIGLVAKHFACRKAAISIKTGASGRLNWSKSRRLMSWRRWLRSLRDARQPCGADAIGKAECGPLN